MAKKILLIVCCCTFSLTLDAQDDLLKLAQEESKPLKEKVTATFKTTKLINAQTNETVHRRTLDFRVGHRFGNIGKYTNGQSATHTLYGLDASTDIRIAFEYGITDALTVGLSRSKLNENYEGLAKIRVLQQTMDNKIPVALTLFANAAITAQKDNAKVYDKTTRRLSYTFQAIIARKFSSRISLAVLPTLVHRNFVFDASDDNDIFALGGAARIKITKGTCFIVDYFYDWSQYRINRSKTYFDPLGAGFELETGGHVFTIMFTNSAGIIENELIPYTTDDWFDGGVKFSFNISRNFRL